MNREYISGCGLIMDLLIITDYVLVEGQFNGKTCKHNQKRLNMNIHLKAKATIRPTKWLKFVLAKYYNVKGRAAYISGRSRNSK